LTKWRRWKNLSNKKDKITTMSAGIEEGVKIAAGASFEGPIGEGETNVGKAIIPTLQGISKAVQKELDKEKPDNVLLDSYSKLYSSLATVMGLYRTSKFSFSLTKAELMIIGVWFIGSIITAGFTIIAGLHAADVATVIASWTAVLLGLIGVSALSSAKK
jgi:hypothetical protein